MEKFVRFWALLAFAIALGQTKDSDANSYRWRPRLVSEIMPKSCFVLYGARKHDVALARCYISLPFFSPLFMLVHIAEVS